MLTVKGVRERVNDKGWILESSPSCQDRGSCWISIAPWHSPCCLDRRFDANTGSSSTHIRYHQATVSDIHCSRLRGGIRQILVEDVTDKARSGGGDKGCQGGQGAFNRVACGTKGVRGHETLSLSGGFSSFFFPIYSLAAITLSCHGWLACAMTGQAWQAWQAWDGRHEKHGGGNKLRMCTTTVRVMCDIPKAFLGKGGEAEMG
ncbi:hypothetical protein B0H65DRAFT_316542 [Neurospora tetraspora]|uniref:Uncharacterized protein n=1 Tax=Neurospora tetraspora TaxID=94610 RepID=A0AAE0J7C7_9PEZI|nr:hypothetical protein B0H65DRAFT_316542 [Neurospora tetraspora]